MFEHIKNEAEKETTGEEGRNEGELYCNRSLDDAHVFEKHKLNLAFFEVVQPLFNHPHYEMKFGFDWDCMKVDSACMKNIIKNYENKLSIMMVSILMQYPMPVECAAVYILGMNTCSEQLVKYLQTLAHAAERFSQTIDVSNVGKKDKELDAAKSIYSSEGDKLPKMVQ
jgi:hypothetical protein